MSREQSAILNFWPSRQIPAIGQEAHRGQEILVGWKSQVRTGFLDRFTDDHSTAVTALVSVGEDLGGGASNKPPIQRVGTGFRHWSEEVDETDGGYGNRYALVSEGEEGARRVWEYMQGDVDARQAAAQTPTTVEDAVDTNSPPATASPGTAPIRVPGDEDGDGDVDKQDKQLRKQREREERERGNG